MTRFHPGCLALALLLACIVPLCACAQVRLGPPRADPGQQIPRVDTFLILAVDVSKSIDPTEKRFQRTTYANVLRMPEIAAAMTAGRHGTVMIAYFEWSGSSHADLVVHPTIIEDRLDLLEVAQRIADPLNRRTPRGRNTTAIGAALHFAGSLVEQTAVRPDHIVIDVSGDGPQNDGRSLDKVRQSLVARGLVINGLPLLYVGGEDTHVDLDSYYDVCVRGGWGSFSLPVRAQEDLHAALKRKILLEIAGRMPPETQGTVVPARAYDISCAPSPDIFQRGR